MSGGMHHFDIFFLSSYSLSSMQYDPFFKKVVIKIYTYQNDGEHHTRHEEYSLCLTL